MARDSGTAEYLISRGGEICCCNSVMLLLMLAGGVAVQVI